jgi:quercetin dioxygenase-like cupin family protein
MQSQRTLLFSAIGFAAGLALGNSDITSGTAQQSYPTETKGIGVAKLGVVSRESMTKQTGLEGYVLQLRLATVAPGGQIARHDHTTRPGLVYTLEGSWVEGRAEGEREYPAGEEVALVEDADTVHWFYNRTDKPAKVLICDLDNR